MKKEKKVIDYPKELYVIESEVESVIPMVVALYYTPQANMYVTKDQVVYKIEKNDISDGITLINATAKEKYNNEGSSTIDVMSRCFTSIMWTRREHKTSLDSYASVFRTEIDACKQWLKVVGKTKDKIEAIIAKVEQGIKKNEENKE